MHKYIFLVTGILLASQQSTDSAPIVRNGILRIINPMGHEIYSEVGTKQTVVFDKPAQSYFTQDFVAIDSKNQIILKNARGVDARTEFYKYKCRFENTCLPS